MEDVKKWIKSNEKLRLFPYKDIFDNWTIGYGRNIQQNGISKEEADFIFDNDFNRCQKELSPFTWYSEQPAHVQSALLNMCFNLGLSRLLKFEKMIGALKTKDYTKASLEALNSLWASQVGDRAKQVALMMRQGF